MSRSARLLFPETIYTSVFHHLFSTRRENAGVLLCGWHTEGETVTLVVKEFRAARHGVDYTTSPKGYGRLEPLFIDEALRAAKSQGLAYLAIHNHFAGDSVSFSNVDLASHEYGYPTLLHLNRPLPVGAAVFGTNSIEVDVWMPDGRRLQLETARVLGHGIRHLWASPAGRPPFAYDEKVDRQLLFLRNRGQGLLTKARIGIVGLGGLGSQLTEPLARLGISTFVLLDPDRIDNSNYSRVHGSAPGDLPAEGCKGAHKVDIAKRLILSINPQADVEALAVDVSKGGTYRSLLTCDYVFLAADSAVARLTCNAVAHQYYVPMLQVGTKVLFDDDQPPVVFGAVRKITPGRGCLWCNGLIDRKELADVGKSEEQLRSEQYGVKASSPSVVTFNAEVAGRALNQFLLQYASEGVNEHDLGDYQMLNLLTGSRDLVEARSAADCPFCQAASRLGAANSVAVPESA
ncbi:ThiF family adenylyltransferase [Herbaspirillum sp. CAH-3]|jgi:hypothetical protein|uniref:ThiF family adenylyltransferase n=1 Tax=Herbaspirillum sp. CAH-3 TaxID=2605746 RepID=UPI0012ACBCD6|nr:ThiF family adenylyltransferase [Herbaspirillum sp. CAH-3]MRT30429.1 hypothetical protein [Herbaspirillum sp. CAH-3]